MSRVLRYPGSKWRLAERILPYIPEHHSYLEPFFGSGAVFFSKVPSRIETINDLDGNVVNLFECIREEPERLAAAVAATPYSREIYDRSFQADKDAGLDRLQRAVAFLVACWQSHGFRSNQYRVGWKTDVQGRERMYSVWDWYRLPEKIVMVAERLRTVQIENRPALEVIGRFDSGNVFMYLDPPYVLETRTGKQYTHEMTDAEHIRLLEAIRATRAKVMISGYENGLYLEYLAGWERVSFPSTTAYGHRRTETVWMNYKAPADRPEEGGDGK